MKISRAERSNKATLRSYTCPAVMRGLDPRIHRLRKEAFYDYRWIAPQLGLARVAQLYAPQVG
jgi:hypothetical protein